MKLNTLSISTLPCEITLGERHHQDGDIGGS